MLEHEQKNVWKMIGMRIRRERIKRNWSQSGLCYGICAVSYLSKIEQGKMEVSEEILKLLLERLELPWIDDKETKDLESFVEAQDRKSTRLNSSHSRRSRMPSSA